MSRQISTDADLLDDDFDDAPRHHSTHAAPVFSMAPPMHRVSQMCDSNGAHHQHGTNAAPAHAASTPAAAPTVRQETLNKLEQFRKRNLGI
jgi:hypothetical protein